MHSGGVGRMWAGICTGCWYQTSKQSGGKPEGAGAALCRPAEMGMQGRWRDLCGAGLVVGLNPNPKP